jgi:hypothetical protein
VGTNPPCESQSINVLPSDISFAVECSLARPGQLLSAGPVTQPVANEIDITGTDQQANSMCIDICWKSRIQSLTNIALMAVLHGTHSVLTTQTTNIVWVQISL